MPRSIAEAAYPNVVLSDSPLAYYRLDDFGTTLSDSSSHGINGTYGSAISHGAGLIATNSDGGALFPGGAWNAAGNAVVPQNTALQPSSVSVEVWVKESAANSTGFIDLVSYGGSSQAWSVQVTPTNTFSGYVVTAGGSIYVGGRTTAVAGTPYHVVLTFDGTTATLYVNGAVDNTATGSGSIAYTGIGTYGLSVGAGQRQSRNVFYGTLDDVALYGSALPAARVSAHYSAATTLPGQAADPYANAVVSDGPTAYYRLDDGTPTLTDATNNHVNGTYGSAVTRHTAGLLTGISDYASSFSGTLASGSTIVTVPQSALLQPASVSLEAWVKEASAATGFTDLVAYGQRSGQGYSLQLSNTNQPAFWAHTTGGAGNVYVSGAAALTQGTVYHLVATYDGTTARLYSNGTQVGSASAGGSLSYAGIGSTGLTLGGSPDGTRATLNGTLDEVAVYSTVLSASQIAAHYTLGSTNPTAGPAHLHNWKYACPDGSYCVNDKNVGLSASWMGAHVDWNEVGDSSSSNGASSTLAAAGAKHIIVYADPNISPYCGPFPTSNPLPVDMPENGARCNSDIASFLHAQNGSYAHAYVHQINGNRLYVIAFPTADGKQTYEPFYIGDPDVQAAFATATRGNAYATDVFEDDAGADYNCIDDYGHCTGTFGPAYYGPPSCTTNSGWCYYYGETGYEWDRASNPQQAYETDAVNLTNAAAHPVIGNNGLSLDSYSLAWARTANLEGVMSEGAWGRRDVDHWLNNADGVLTYHALHKFVVELCGDSTDLFGQLASHWIVYDPTYSVLGLDYPHPASSGSAVDETFPEETVVPSQPLVPAPSSNDVTAFQTSPNEFVREYAVCYQAGVAIGRCAAVVNIGSGSAAISGLTRSYGHVLVQNRTTTWYNGGTPQWSTSVPATVAAQGGVILAQ